MGWGKGFTVFLLFFILETEQVSRGEGQRERARASILSRLHTQCGAQHGARSHNPGIMTWAEIKSWSLYQMSHRGTPEAFTFSEKSFSGWGLPFFLSLDLLPHWLVRCFLALPKSPLGLPVGALFDSRWLFAHPTTLFVFCIFWLILGLLLIVTITLLLLSDLSESSESLCYIAM